MKDEAPRPPEPLINERVSFRQVNGLRLLCREWGPAGADPVVLLHGLRGFSGTWRSVAAALSHRYRLIAFDQRGRGESDWDPGRNYYTDAYLADLEALVDQLALGDFTLIGHSMGGTTSFAYAARHPQRLRGLVIEDMAPGSSAAGPGAERIRAEMIGLPLTFGSWCEARAYWRARRPGVSAEAVEQRLAESLRALPDGRIGWRYDADGIRKTRLQPDSQRVLDLWPLIERLTVPTLIVRGELSDFCPSSTVDEITARNPLITSATVPGATHYVHDEHPGAFVALLERFLESPPVRTRPPGARA